MLKSMTPKERATKAAAVMWENDRSSPWVGMTLDDIDEGHSRMSLVVQSNHVNGHNICHGGIIFMLADSAFAFACNSRNQNTVAQHNSITYVSPGRLGDKLTARAHEVSLSGRNGVYDVTVTNQNNQVIAEFRGCSRAIRGQLFAE